MRPRDQMNYWSETYGLEEEISLELAHYASLNCDEIEDIFIVIQTLQNYV